MFRRNKAFYNYLQFSVARPLQIDGITGAQVNSLFSCFSVHFICIFLQQYYNYYQPKPWPYSQSHHLCTSIAPFLKQRYDDGDIYFHPLFHPLHHYCHCHIGYLIGYLLLIQYYLIKLKYKTNLDQKYHGRMHRFIFGWDTKLIHSTYYNACIFK